MSKLRAIANKEVINKNKNLKQIYMRDVKSGDRPLINQACHYNSTHEVKNGNAIAIAEVLVINGGIVTAHYICMDKNGDYYDPTLGWAWSGCEYRLVRLIASDSNELQDANKMLCDFKDRLLDMCSKKVKLACKLTGKTSEDLF